MVRRIVTIAILLAAAAYAHAAPATLTNALQLDGEAQITRYSETSTANAILTITIAPGHPFRVMGVYAKYSATVTKNVTTTLDNGAGAAYDALLSTIAISAATAGLYEPTVMRWYSSTDALVIASEAGGGGVTCGIVVYLEVRK